MKKFCVFLLLTIGTAFLANAQNLLSLRMEATGTAWAGDYERSLAAWDKIIGQSSDPAPAYLLGKGKALYRLHRFDEALNDFETAGKEDNHEALLWAARCYTLQGNSGEAVTRLKAYLSSASFDEINQIRKDTLLKNLHGTDEWFQLWQREWYTEEMLLMKEAEYYKQRKNYTRAHELVEDRLAEATGSAVLHAYNAGIYQVEGNPTLALNEINHALSLQPDNPEWLRQKVAYLQSLGSDREAFRILSGLISKNPDDFDLHYQRAKLGLELGELVLAREDAELMLLYSQADSLVFMGGELAYALGNYVEALKYFNDLLEKDQSKASYFKARGLTYYQTRIYKQAGYDLSMSLDLDPDDPEVNYYKGLTENAMGDTHKACYYMQRALRYEYPPAKAYLDKHCTE